MIPRVRGKVGVVETPEEHKGKFAFEVSLWTLDGETILGKPFGPFGPFDTEQKAQEELKVAVRNVCSIFEKDGKLPEKYLDMKNGGVLRPWVEH